MCRLRNIAMCDYQECVTTGQTHRQTDAGQSDPYVPLCFAGDTKMYVKPVYANYVCPSVMTDANSEGFPICDERITENDRCVIKIIGIHWLNAWYEKHDLHLNIITRALN